MPDDRLTRLVELCNPRSVVPATVEIVDIAGLVKSFFEFQKHVGLHSCGLVTAGLGLFEGFGESAVDTPNS